MVSTSQTLARRAALLGAAAMGLAGCVSRATPPPPSDGPAGLDAGAFIMADGARLPYRAWLPDGAPRAVVLALHGFNDSRDAWELPGPALAAAGIAVYGYDQRGFGAAPLRGRWAGAGVLQRDAADLAVLLRARHPGADLVLMGESMGGAVLMCLATSTLGPEGARYVLLAPAVWGRARMNPLFRAALWMAVTFLPTMSASRPPPGVRILPTDNMEAWARYSRDPLTLRGTRFDTLGGLVDLMDAALAAAANFRAPALFLYGGEDMLIPPEATRATWQALPQSNARRAFYPNGYHLLPRDLDRAAPTGDIVSWILDPAAALPSGADLRAADWLSKPG